MSAVLSLVQARFIVEVREIRFNLVESAHKQQNQALNDGLRTDLRSPCEHREPRIEVHSDGVVEVSLGSTLVLALVSGELSAPLPERGTEGRLTVVVEVTSMVSPDAESSSRQSESATVLGRVIERSLKQSHAVDLESLVLQAGRFVWEIRVEVRVLADDGNVAGAASLATLAALLTFRRPEVTFSAETGRATKHATATREALPLSLHHLPVAVSFALFGAGDQDVIAMDPSATEEEAAGGALSVFVNAHGEVCAIQKIGGCATSAAELQRCVRLAVKEATRLTTLLRVAADAHTASRLAARVRRKRTLPTPLASRVFDATEGANAMEEEEEDTEEDSRVTKLPLLRREAPSIPRTTGTLAVNIAGGRTVRTAGPSTNADVETDAAPLSLIA